MTIKTMCECPSLLVAVKENEHIRVAVGSGQRPDLSIVIGPETLTKPSVDWIERCWHQNPDMRPEFAGILHESLVAC